MTDRTTESLPPVVKEVDVSLSQEAAFRRFTEEMASWWLLESHSVGEKNALSVTFEAAGSGGQWTTFHRRGVPVPAAAPAGRWRPRAGRPARQKSHGADTKSPGSPIE